MFGGRGTGGGSGGGNVLRTVGRAVTRAGVANGGVLPELLSSSSSNPNTPPTPSPKRTQKPSSSNSLFCAYNNSNNPVYASSGIPNWSAFSQCEEFEWVCEDDIEDENSNGSFEDFVLGPVPSLDEVQHAVSALHQVFGHISYSRLVTDRLPSDLEKDIADQVTTPNGVGHQVSSVGSDLDWIEPSLHLCSSRMSRTQGIDGVYDAFHLLRTEPSVQRMVVSLSLDRAVWEAVLNNEAVQELRESFAAGDKVPFSRDENSSRVPGNAFSEATKVAKWIFENTKAKVMEVIEKIMNLVNDFFPFVNDEKKTKVATDPFEEKLRTSLLLSVVVLLIVVVTRANRG